MFLSDQYSWESEVRLQYSMSSLTICKIRRSGLSFYSSDEILDTYCTILRCETVEDKISSEKIDDDIEVV
jgi:hypothetical protein